MELLDLPPEILSLICSHLVDAIGIRQSCLVRRCSHTVNKHMLDAIYSLPTFNVPDYPCPPNLAFDLRMDKSLVAGLIRSKLYNHQYERQLTQEILRTADFAAEIFGGAHGETYQEALAHLAAEELPLHEIVRGLSRGSSLLDTSSDPLENALAAALLLGHHAHALELLHRGSRAQRRTKWFGDALDISAGYASAESFMLVLGHAFSTQDGLTHKLASSRLIVALERGAAKGRVELFATQLWADGKWSWLGPSPLEALKPALSSATLACHDHIVLAIFNLLEEYGIGRLSPQNEESFWMELLRVAAANGSKSTVCLLLTRTTPLSTKAKLDEPLEDACRGNHRDVVEVLLSCESWTHYRSSYGAIYWAARNARWDILELLLRESASRESLFVDNTYFEDALAGASIHGAVGYRAVFEAAAEYGGPPQPANLEGKTFARLVDEIWEGEAFRRLAAKDGASDESLDRRAAGGDTFDESGPEQNQRRLIQACMTWDFLAMRRTIRAIALSEDNTAPGTFEEAVDMCIPSILQYLCESFPTNRHFPRDGKYPSTAAMQVMLDHGWDVSALEDPTDPDTTTVLGVAIGSEATTHLLLDRGASPNTANLDTRTPLSAAIGTASWTTISMLLQRGGDTRKGALLHHAIKRRDVDRTDCADRPDQLAIIDTLLAFGAPLNAPSFERDHSPWLAHQVARGWKTVGTALHDAAKEANADVVALLLQRGADASIRDTEGRTAYDVAVNRPYRRYRSIVEMLR